MGMPEFFAINDRPVKVVKDPEGGWDTYALDMGTGDWVLSPQHLDRYRRRDGDIDAYTEEQFNARVAEVRERIGKVMPED